MKQQNQSPLLETQRQKLMGNLGKVANKLPEGEIKETVKQRKNEIGKPVHK